VCDDVRVTDEVLADQVDYYRRRRRAGEYDVTAYGDVVAARARIARLVAEMRPAGSVLEIACGTGLWTRALAGWADTVTAIDAAPEMVAIARDGVRSARVSFEVADVFSWDPGTRFDVVFFSAWPPVRRPDVVLAEVALIADPSPTDRPDTVCGGWAPISLYQKRYRTLLVIERSTRRLQRASVADTT